MYISILGRQPEIGLAELYAKDHSARLFSAESAIFSEPAPDISRLGGSLKLGKIIKGPTRMDTRQTLDFLLRHYVNAWKQHSGKITVGFSFYDLPISKSQLTTFSTKIKQRATSNSGSIRLLPNKTPALSTATSHHNKLGLSANKIEIIIVQNQSGEVIVAESMGAQNITAYAARDQKRPKRDAFVGMLPPKLAQIMINLAVGNLQKKSTQGTILDPFCGTGVVLQEAALMGYATYGSDLSDKMVAYSKENLTWLAQKYPKSILPILEEGNATSHIWKHPVDAVVCETYLGQPFSAPPSPAKLREVRLLCNKITTDFLANIRTQLKPGTPLCLAVPAWKDTDGQFTHLPLVTQSIPGYKRAEQPQPTPLLYHRPDQIVARELMTLIAI